MSEQKKRLLVLTGPTASGKSACAVHLSHILDGEVVSADSMQLYRGLEILSAVPTIGERQDVPHHLFGVLDPTEKCTASRYRELASDALRGVYERGKTPILCGGSGLYISALITAARFSVESDPALHAELMALADQPGGTARLHAMLEECDPVSAARLHPNDVRRVARAIEIYTLTGKTQTEHIQEDEQAERPYDDEVYALEWPREELYRRIDERVDCMVATGLFREAAALLDRREEILTAGQAIGLREIFAALQGRLTSQEAIETMKRLTRNYAKRQISWIRHLPDVHWIRADAMTPMETASMIASKWKKVEEAL